MSDHDSLDLLAADFLERHRRGERPSISEYIDRSPGRADEIREVFPALAVMERLKPARDDSAGSISGAPNAPLPAIEHLADYRIIREIGRGGMGVVFEAIQESLGRHVALKVLTAHARLDATLLERFRLEARSAARLHHTNIVPVFDIGEEDSLLYYSMQFIQGQPLDLIIDDLRRIPALPAQEGRLSTSDQLVRSSARYYQSVARIGAQVADALGYAHAQGVLHRDIKPSNLLLDAVGQVWVADFGLAKLEGCDGPTGAGDVIGTIRYMAPERFSGRSDPRSDVYGLGATLYELLALKPAFDCPDRPHLMEQILHTAPPELKKVDSRVPPDLEAIVLKCLAKEPTDRFQGALELRDELNRVVQNLPTRTRPLARSERLWRSCKRNPLIAALSSLAATLVIVIVVVSMVAAYRNGRLAMVATENLFQAKRNLVQAYTAEAEARRSSRRVGQQFETLTAVDRARTIASEVGITENERLTLRSHTASALALPDLRISHELGISRALKHGVVVDSQLKRFASRLDDGTVVVRRLADGSEESRFTDAPPTADHISAQFSADGRYLAMTSQGHSTLKVWDLSTKQLVLTEPRMVPSNTINWSFRPDSREIALPHSEDSVAFYELPSGKLLPAWTGQRSRHVSYSPDGCRLAFDTSDWRTVQVASRDGSRFTVTPRNPANINHFAWNPRRANVLAVACEDGRVYIWDVDRKRQTTILKGEFGNGLVIAYHPGGDLLASRGWSNVLRLWDTRTGQQLLARPSSWLPALEFDLTGRWLSVDPADDNACILEFAQALACRTIVRDPFKDTDRHGALATDPTGDRAVTTGSSVTVWDLATGATLATLPVTGVAHKVLFDSTGAIITERPTLARWPITQFQGRPARIGPPQSLHLQGTTDGLAISSDGGTLAAAMYSDGGLLLTVQNPARARLLRKQLDVRYIAISPDGRWVVTGSHFQGGGLMLWDVRSGAEIHDFPGVPKHITVADSFSADGRWLAINWDGWVLFETATWKHKVRLMRGLSRSLALAPDSRVAAFDENASTLVLVEVNTGRKLLRLEDPDQARIDRIAFTRDGASLVTTLIDRPYMRIWDLHAIRGHLAKLGLDWEPGPALDAVAPSGTSPVSRTAVSREAGHVDPWVVEPPETPDQTLQRMTRAIESNPSDVETYENRGDLHFRLNHFDAAIADFTAALTRRPDDIHLIASRALAYARSNHLDAAITDGESVLELRSRRYPGVEPDEMLLSLAHEFNEQAWNLANAPVARREPSQARRLARIAAEVVPKDTRHLNTYGVALYRAAKYAEAIPVLERSLLYDDGETAGLNLFVLAMARHCLRQSAAARADFDHALHWTADHQNLDAPERDELKTFRAEAQAVLAVPAGDLPEVIFGSGGSRSTARLAN